MKEIFCTCIIPTVGRDSLSRAVGSVLSQSLTDANFEIIVVNDSGKPLSGQAWQASDKVHIINTIHRERSVARNTGAALARGRYLHFLDDDDWIAADAYQHFWDLSRRTGAVWLYGMTQLFDRQLEPTIVLRHAMNGNQLLAVMAGEWIPLQASLIERNTFLQAGGFNPLLTGPEDIDLLRRILITGDLAESPNLTACVIRGEAGSTTNYRVHSTQSRRAREGILETGHIFKRMRATANDAFWQSRLLRIYLTSVIWNIRNRQVFTAASRAMYALAALWHGGVNLFRPGFWASVSTPYASQTFARGIQGREKELAGHE
jgi:glycosyltransferase involved in cell wall biosynthesis